MNKQSLQELRDKVEAGERPDTLLLSRAVGLHPDDRHISAAKAYNGSIDAAIAFLEAVLPGWVYVVTNISTYKKDHCLCAVSERNNDAKKIYETEADTPARALLLATLDALIERAE